MWHKFWHKLNNSVTGGALIIAFFSFSSKLLGLLRERLIAHNFGASELSDIYYASFRLPDLIFNTLVLGALSSAFIPVFQKIWFKDKKEGLRLANSVLNFLLILVGFLLVLVFIFSPQIMKLITPGFAPWQLEMTITLSRIMLLAVIFFVVSNLIGGVLNSWKKFFSFSLAANLYNLGIIFGIVVLYPLIGLSGLAWGVVLGAFFHLLVQLPEVYKYGWRFQLTFDFNSNVKKIFKLMLPRTLGLAASQINLVIITMIASSLTVGSIAVFNMANNLQSLPISIFALSLAIAVFPTFTQALSSDNKKLFADNFSLNFRRILYILVPISVLTLVLRAQIVRIILGSGAFNWDNTYYTAQTLGFFSLSIFAQGLIPLLARSFYAFEDTKTPMLISIFSISINIFLAWFLAPFLGVMGLALAFSIANIINMFLLYFIISIKIIDIDHNKILKSLLRIIFNSVLCGLSAYLMLQVLSSMVNMRTFIGIFIQGAGAASVGLLIYVLTSILFKLEEVDIVKKFLLKFWIFLKNGKH